MTMLYVTTAMIRSYDEHGNAVTTVSDLLHSSLTLADKFRALISSKRDDVRIHRTVQWTPKTVYDESMAEAFARYLVTALHNVTDAIYTGRLKPPDPEKARAIAATISDLHGQLTDEFHELLAHLDPDDILAIGALFEMLGDEVNDITSLYYKLAEGTITVLQPRPTEETRTSKRQQRLETKRKKTKTQQTATDTVPRQGKKYSTWKTDFERRQEAANTNPPTVIKDEPQYEPVTICDPKSAWEYVKGVTGYAL